MGLHPLHGWIRWILFPTLTATGGGLAAFLGIYLSPTANDQVFILAGGVMGAASSLATSISAKVWLRVLLGPVIGIFGYFMVLMYCGFPVIVMNRPLWVELAQFFLNPQVMFAIVLWTTLPVVLHALTFRWDRHWKYLQIPATAGAGLLAAVTLSLNEPMGLWSGRRSFFFGVVYFLLNPLTAYYSQRLSTRVRPKEPVGASR